MTDKTTFLSDNVLLVNFNSIANSGVVVKPIVIIDGVIEPNDTIYDATATNLYGSGTYNISIEIGDNPNLAPENDVDLFELQLDAGDRLRADIDASEIGSTLDPILTLFDSDGILVTQNDDFNSLDSFLGWTAEFDDTYYVGVSSYANFDYDPLVEGSGSGSSSGFYDLFLTVGNGGIEPNDTIYDATATNLYGSGTYNISTEIGDNLYLVPEDDVDLFELQLNRGDRLRADIDAIEFGSTLDPILTVFDSDGTLVEQNDDFDDLDSYVEITAERDDTYYVGVSSYANFDYDPWYEGSGSGYSYGFYDLSLTVEPKDIEPNDTIVEATATNLYGSGTYNISTEIGDNPFILAADDVDLFELQLNRGDRLWADIDAREIGSTLDPILTVFDSGGTLVAQNDDFDGRDSYLEIIANHDGIYYVGVSSYANFDYDPEVEGSGYGYSSGFYDLSLTVDPGEIEPNDIEPNDTIVEATATNLDGPGTYNIFTEIGDNPNLLFPQDDVDLFELQLDAGDRLRADIDASELGSTLDPILSVFDSGGTLVAQNNDFDGHDSYLEITAEFDDTYYVGVSSYANFDYDPKEEGSGYGYSSGVYDLFITVDDVA